MVLQLLPQVFVGPLAGVINDRRPAEGHDSSDLARVVIVRDAVRGADGEAAVYVLLALETMMWSFFEPGRTAVVPNLVSNPEDTATATALSSATWSVNFAIGSALGGLVGVSLGFTAVFALNAMTFLLSAFCISRMQFVSRTRRINRRGMCGS